MPSDKDARLAFLEVVQAEAKASVKSLDRILAPAIGG